MFRASRTPKQARSQGQGDAPVIVSPLRVQSSADSGAFFLLSPLSFLLSLCLAPSCLLILCPVPACWSHTRIHTHTGGAGLAPKNAPSPSGSAHLHINSTPQPAIAGGGGRDGEGEGLRDGQTGGHGDEDEETGNGGPAGPRLRLFVALPRLCLPSSVCVWLSGLLSSFLSPAQ